MKVKGVDTPRQAGDKAIAGGGGTPPMPTCPTCGLKTKVQGEDCRPCRQRKAKAVADASKAQGATS